MGCREKGKKMTTYSPAHVAAGIRYVIAYSPGCYSVRESLTGIVLSEHKSKGEARKAVNHYKAADARREKGV
jgi:hypothetical protein